MNRAQTPARRFSFGSERDQDSLASQIQGRLQRGLDALGERLSRPGRRLETIAERQYGQVEALIGLYSTLDIALPLPPMRGFPVSPDFACSLASLIAVRRPDTIVELGSGVSTLIAAYALKKNGAGRILSLEHDREWCRKSAELVRQHGLESTATIVHAPLTPVTIVGEHWMWYDTSVIDDRTPIDMLVIDGPPANIQRLARYPAVPLLRDRLSARAVIMLDDADRPDEREIVSRWNREFGPYQIERPATEKGLAMLTSGVSA